MSKVFNIARLDQRMAPDLPGCPQTMRVLGLMDALHEFCRDSEAWREELAPIDVVTATLTYNLVPGFDANIQRVEWVKLWTEAGVTAGTEPDPLDDDLWTVTPGDPDTLTLADTLEPVANITDGLTVKAVLVPEFQVLDVAEWFGNRYWKAILSGAMDIRMRDPNKRWTNPAKAAEFRAFFHEEIATAKGELRRQYKNGPIEIGA